MTLLSPRSLFFLAAICCAQLAMGQQQTANQPKPRPAPKTAHEMREEDRAHRDAVIAHFPPAAANAVSLFLDVPYIRDGREEHQIDIYVPKGTGPFPLVLIIHGGGWNAGDKAGAGLGMAMKLIPAGYVVASVNYRFLREAPFPAQIEDCFTALNWLRDHATAYKIDPNRVGVVGHSAGGHLTALLATTAGTPAFHRASSDCKPVQAAVVVSGVSDLRKEAGWGPKAFPLGKVYSEEAAALASPIHYVHAGLPPFMIVHGAKDPLVPVIQATLLADALKKVSADVTLRLVPGGDHGVMQPDGFDGAKTLFDRTLLGGEKTQSAQPQPAPSIAAVLQPFVDHHVLAGAVALVASKDKVLSLDAVGYSDLASKKPMPTDALCAIASMGKPIAATAMMMLVDENKVSLDDPVTKYLPEFGKQMVVCEKAADHVLLRKPQQPIRIRNLLNHTSGLLYLSPIEAPTYDSQPLSTRVRSYAMMPLQFEPGSKHLYSSAGINTAARIIEVVSNMPYEDFLEQRLFKPLGMKDTTFWPSEAQSSRLSVFYQANAAGNGLEPMLPPRFTYPLTDHNTRYPIPGSGLFSTAGDMAVFCQMILNGGIYHGKRYVSEAAVKQMTSKQTGAAIKVNYGFGWETGLESFGHGGSFRTFMRVYPKKNLIAIFMTQTATDWPGKEGKNVMPAFNTAIKSFASASRN